MLRFYVSLSRRLHPARWIVWLLAGLSVGGFAATLLFSRGRPDEAYMLAAVALLLWSLCLLVVIYTFVHPLPALEPGDRWLVRVKKKLSLGMRWIMAWTTTLLCLAVVYVTFRAGSIAVGSLGG